MTEPLKEQATYDPWPEYFELAELSLRNRSERLAREAKEQQQKPA